MELGVAVAVELGWPGRHGRERRWRCDIEIGRGPMIVDNGEDLALSTPGRGGTDKSGSQHGSGGGGGGGSGSGSGSGSGATL